MDGIDLTDPLELESALRPVRDLLSEWLTDEAAGRIVEAAPDSHLSAAAPLIRGLKAASPPVQIDGRGRSQVREILVAAGVGHVLREAGPLSGFSSVESTLKALAAAGQFDKFLDAVFELESAVYFHRHFAARSVVFEEGSHPDLWVQLWNGTGPRTLPCECKRIEPTDRVQQLQDELAADLETGLGAASAPPAAVLVQLHGAATSVTSDELVQSVARLLAQAGPSSTRWITTSDGEGRYQATVRPLGDLAEMKRRAIELEDIRPMGSIIVRAKTLYQASEKDPMALQSLIRVTNDRLPDRIGAFERNLFKAISQLESTTAGSAPGIVTVRLRPPRGLGDLYEADQIVRRVLRDRQAAHVALVMLVWNESEHETPSGKGDERSTLAYHLKPHFIANPLAAVRFDSIDSAPARFPPLSHRMVRDPGTGELSPIDVSFLDSPAGCEPLPPDERAITLYGRLARPYDDDFRGPFPKYVTYGDRKLAIVFMDDFTAKALELIDGHFTHVATVDLRAWLGEPDLGFVVEWLDEGFRLRVLRAGSEADVVARSVAVRGVYV